MTIYDGESGESSLLAKLCGSLGDVSEVRSTTNKVFIQFKTDSSVVRNGFELIYSATPKKIIKEISMAKND